MRQNDIVTLFDFNYWANRQLLAATAAATAAQFVAPPQFTYRGLRGTLVHTLDVEWSWRIRVRGAHPELWDKSLADDDYATVAALAEHWARDETEMRSWLEGLSDAELGEVANLGNGDRFPLWYYLVHIVTHSEPQRRDAALILNALGHQVPDLEFLYYADTLAAR